MVKPQIFISNSFYKETIAHWEKIKSNRLRHNDPLYKITICGFSDLILELTESEAQELIKNDKDPYLKELLFENSYKEHSSKVSFNGLKEYNLIVLQKITSNNPYSYFLSSLPKEDTKEHRDNYNINHYSSEDWDVLTNKDSFLTYDDEIISGKLKSYKEIIIHKSNILVIIDPFLLTDNKNEKLKNNLYEIIKAAISPKLKERFNLLIFCSFLNREKQPNKKIIKANKKNIEYFLKLNYPQITFQFGICHYNQHDRRILTSQLYIISQNSFDFFISPYKIHDRSKSDSVEISSILTKEKKFFRLIEKFKRLSKLLKSSYKNQDKWIGPDNLINLLDDYITH